MILARGVQRAILGRLTRDAGYRIRWADMDPGPNPTASAATRDGDTTPLRGMLERFVAPLTSPPRRAPPV